MVDNDPDVVRCCLIKGFDNQKKLTIFHNKTSLSERCEVPVFVQFIMVVDEGDLDLLSCFN